MDKEKEKSKIQQEKGTENPINHLLRSFNSMEMTQQVSSDSNEVSETDDSSSKALVCVDRSGRSPNSDNNIMCAILSRIRSKYLMRFKSVCTKWKSLIETDSSLIDLHYRFNCRRMRPLLFISSPPSPKHNEPNRLGRATIDFTMIAPTEVQKLELDRSNFGIPKQTVAGLVCITSGSEAFLIYNPCTGERTPWIETTTVNENIGVERKREVDCIAFGYSPDTKEHKVLCISSTQKKGVGRGLSIYIPSMPYTEEYKSYCLEKMEDGEESKEHADGLEEVGADEEQVCEVFTVGENTWRRIDAVPPYSLASKVCYVGDLAIYNQESKSVYVNGKIYWRFRYTGKGEMMMVFDVSSEKFSVISIPGYVTETPWKYPQTVELLEVDGRIAVLNFTPGCPISLWLLDQDDDGTSDKWSYEKVRTPCDWNGVQDLSIKYISGANCIILKQHMSEITYVYHLVKKVYTAFTVNEAHGLDYQPGELREILTTVDNLTPVSTKRCNMF